MEVYDVVVCGGGFAGTAAALSAAREGAKVLLIEYNNCLGGAAAECLVNPFMPYWTRGDDGNRLLLSSGIFRRFSIVSPSIIVFLILSILKKFIVSSISVYLIITFILKKN